MGLRSWVGSLLTPRASDPAQDERYWTQIDGGVSVAGVRVTAETALRVSAVYRCVSIIANSGALLPGGVYQRLERGRREVPTHPVRRLLWKVPNPFQRPFEFKRVMFAWAILRGSAYARIYRQPDGSIELWPLHPDRVRGPEMLEDGRRRYYYRRPDTGVEDAYLADLDILVINGLSLDGIRGLALSDLARDSIGLAQATEQFGATMFGRGAKFSGGLQLPVGKSIANAAARDQLRKSIADQGAGPGKWWGIPIFEDGMEWKNISMTNDDAQFLECVVPETEVALADGTRKRADELLLGDVVLGWDAASGSLVPSPVDDVSDNGVRDVLTIRTHRGREITVTHNHPFLASRRARCKKCGRNHSADPMMGSSWVEAGKLSVGDYLSTLDGVEWQGTDEISPEDAYFVGAMLGDGSIRQKGALAFSNKDEKVLEAVGCGAARYGAEMQYRSGVDYELTGGAKIGRPASGGPLSQTNPLRWFFEELGLLGTDCHSKFIPPAIFRSGSRQVAEVMAGLFDTGGSVRQLEDPQPMAYVCTVSQKMATDSQHALSLLGIQAAIRTQQPTRERESVRYEVVVCGRENIRRLSGLPLRHPEKARRLAGWAAQASPSERDVFRRMDRIVDIRDGGQCATIGITVGGTHSHVTAGLVSHNTRKFSITDIARWFGVPPHMIGDVERSTSWGTGIEAQSIGFITYGLMPWLALFEQCFEAALIAEEDYYLRFNVGGLLRADVKTRFEVYDVAIRNGIYSPNDCRELEDENPREGGDEYVTPTAPQQSPNTQPKSDAQDEPPDEPPDDEADPNAAALIAKVWTIEQKLAQVEEQIPKRTSALAQLRSSSAELGIPTEAVRKLVAQAKKGDAHVE